MPLRGRCRSGTGCSRPETNSATSNPSPGPGEVAAATAGSAYQASARVTVIRIESAVRPGRRSSRIGPSQPSAAAGWAARICSGTASSMPCAHWYTSFMVRPSSAAACSRLASTEEALPIQNAMSCRPLDSVAAVNDAARCSATAGCSQPRSGFHRKVEGRPPMPSGLNTCSTPCRPRSAAVLTYRSVRVVVVMTAPGWSMIRSASHPDLPVRGAASDQRLVFHAGDDPAARGAPGPAGPRSRSRAGAAAPTRAATAGTRRPMRTARSRDQRTASSRMFA